MSYMTQSPLRAICTLRPPVRHSHAVLITRQTRSYTAGPSRLPDDGRYDILFCGSDSFSVASLEALIEAEDVYRSIRVLTQLPKSKGKGKAKAGRLDGLDKLSGRPLEKYRPTLREFAEDHDLPVDLIRHPEGIDGYVPRSPFDVPSTNTLLVTASFGYILPNAFLARFASSNRLNVHPSLLPRWRGAAPIQWTIAAGDTSTGVSVQRLVEKTKGIDAGELVGVVEDIPVPSNSTYWDLLPRLASAGGALLVDTIRQMAAGKVSPLQQDPTKVTRAPKIRHALAQVRWSEHSAIAIDRLHRGIGHQEALWTLLPNTSTQLQLLNISAPAVTDLPHRVVDKLAYAPPGTAILNKGTKALYVACSPDRSDPKAGADGGLVEQTKSTVVQVTHVRLAGRKETPVWEWWNGLREDVRLGNRVRFT